MSIRREEIWTIKHKPKRIEDIVGNEEAKKAFLDWLNIWLKGKVPVKKAILLYGPPGIGKTLLAETAALQFNLELIEINAGDIYSVEFVKKTALATSKETSFVNKTKLILVDELDSIEGPKANYVLSVLVDLIKESRYPVVLIANDGWKPNLFQIRNLCLMIEMKRLSTRLIVNYLANICKKENLKYEEEALKIIAERSEGDMRSAILDLQFCSIYGRIGVREVNLLSPKDRQSDVFNSIRKLIYATNLFSAKSVLDEFPYDQDTLLLWIEENLFRFYTNPKDLALAYEKLSKADIYRARANKERYWRFLLYFSDLITAGVALSKSQKPTYAKMQFPQTLKVLSGQKRIRELRDALLEKISKKNHLSKSKALNEIFWYLPVMFKNEKFANDFIKKYEVNDELTDYLKNLSSNIDLKLKTK
jgi:replication factor C large subunit